MPLGWAVAEAQSAAWQGYLSESDPAKGWNWIKIFRNFAVCGALQDEDGAVVAMLACKKGIVTLESEPLLRVDRLVVDPRLRRQGIGVRAMFALAELADAWGAAGVVLASTPDATEFYERLGATQAAPEGWNVEAGLLPFHWRGDDFAALLEASRAAQIPSSSGSDNG